MAFVQATCKPKAAQPVHQIILPTVVWKTINVDYLGQLPNGKYILATIEQRSRYPVVTFTNSTSAKHLISIIQRVFSEFGYSKKINSDNGPPFKSHEIKQYMKKEGIRYISKTMSGNSTFTTSLQHVE